MEGNEIVDIAVGEPPAMENGHQKDIKDPVHAVTAPDQESLSPNTTGEFDLLDMNNVASSSSPDVMIVGSTEAEIAANGPVNVTQPAAEKPQEDTFAAFASARTPTISPTLLPPTTEGAIDLLSDALNGSGPSDMTPQQRLQVPDKDHHNVEQNGTTNSHEPLARSELTKEEGLGDAAVVRLNNLEGSVEPRQEQAVATESQAPLPPTLHETPLSSIHHDQEVAKKAAEQQSALILKELQQTKTVNSELDRTIKVLREQLKTVQLQFDRQLAATADAKQVANAATAQVQMLQTELVECRNFLKEAQIQTATARELQAKSDHELHQLRTESDEQQRAKMALEVRLNDIRKAEVEHYEEDLKAAHDDLDATRQELAELQRSKANVENDWKFAEQRVHEVTVHYEGLLSDEKKRNEQRKAKMKVFVDKKTDELRQAKEDCDNLQNEIAQTNRSLLDMDQRWKQLHAQWAQTQTRNRYEMHKDHWIIVRHCIL
jgi:hypothetical protein